MANVWITKGASDWRVYQQINGFADIHLEGICEKVGNDRVYVRVLREDDLTCVIDWTPVDATKGVKRESFEITLHVPAGGLYRIDTTIAEGLTGIDLSRVGQHIYHIGVGNLFVIAGQSNFAGRGRTPIVDPPELGVHLCKNSEEWTIAAHPMNDPLDTAHPANFEPASAHSPFLAFGRKMKKELGCPIGLIQESLGGSPISLWNTRLSGRLYTSMAESVRRVTEGDMRVAGILWYQGCSDANEYDAPPYYERFEQTVNDMRRDFRSPDLPIYTVQLNGQNGSTVVWWSVIREAQRAAAKNIKNVFVIPAVGLPMDDGIHNSSLSNIVIGERLARVALKGFYGKNIPGFAPDIENAKYSGSDVTLEFANVSHYLNTLGVPPAQSNFEVTDENGAAAVVGYDASSNRIRLKTDRELSGKVLVTFVPAAQILGEPPYDEGTGLPILAFRDFEAKSEK